MKQTCCFLMLLLTLPVLSAAAPAEDNTEPAIFLNALHYGAKADGQSDDTAAIQAALDAAGETGTPVLLPAGQYRLNGRLTVPDGVALRGVWPGPHTSHLDKGTVLLLYAGRDDEKSSATITLATSSTLQGVTIFYPEQTVEEIRPYPWTIQGKGLRNGSVTSQHFNILDVTIVNAYNGIDCGSYHNEGHHLRNVHMCALNKGVYVDLTTDVGRMENVHIHNVYWWRVSAPYTLSELQIKALEQYTLAHLEGFIIGRTDWEYISNCFVIWAKVGFHFIANPDGQGMANAQITQSGSDIGPRAVLVDQVQKHAGVIFENCQFMSVVEVGQENKGPVKFSNCGFWGKGDTGSHMLLHGQGTVSLSNSHFTWWDQNKENKPCIDVYDGSLLMSSSEVISERENLTHVRLGPKVKSAAITGNRFRQTSKPVLNQSNGDVQLVGNVMQ